MKKLIVTTIGAGLVFAWLAASPRAATATLSHRAERWPASESVSLQRRPSTNWLAKSETVPAWCFFKAANVALVDGEAWSLNGISRQMKGAELSFEGKTYKVIDVWDKSQPHRDFASFLNDRVNDACP